MSLGSSPVFMRAVASPVFTVKISYVQDEGWLSINGESLPKVMPRTSLIIDLLTVNHGFRVGK